MINLYLSQTKSMSYRIVWMLFLIPSCVLSANELHKRYSQRFSCSDQILYYPFWISGREECGHPDFKVECNTSFAEVSFSSVKFRILEANYESRFIRLARSDYIGDLCPKNPSNVPFYENVLPLAPNSDLLTIYYDCSQDFSQYVSSNVGALACDNNDDRKNYYVTRNLSSPLLEGISSVLNNFRGFCDRNVSIPASGPALNTMQITLNTDNLKKALEEGFELGLNQDCSTCLASTGACGYNWSSSRFICYNMDRTRNKARNKESDDRQVGSSKSSMYFPEWIYKDLEKRGSGRLIENGISNEEDEIMRKMTVVGLWCPLSHWWVCNHIKKKIRTQMTKYET